jgi:hypothetical protein
MKLRARSFSASAVFLLYLTLFAWIFHPVVFGDMTFMRRDIMLYYYPMWKFAATSIKAGFLPFWNPFANYGVPFFANPQTCTLNPLALLLFQMPDFTRMFNVYIVLHFALAASFTYLWMRGLRAGRAAAALAGLAFASSGTMMSSVNLTIALCSVAYFPLCLYAFRRALGERRFFWKGLTAAALLLEYLAGDPAVLFATFFIFTLVVAYKMPDALLKKDFRRALEPVWAFTQTALAFLGLAAFHLLVFAEFLSLSIRKNLSAGESTLWSMHYDDLLGAMIPYFSDVSLYVMNYWIRQSWLENYYAGMVVFVLAAAALARRGETVGRHFLLGFTGVALALGQFSAVHGLLRDYYPFFRFVRYPVRFFFLFSFAAACLAGLGLDRVLDRKERLLPSGWAGTWGRAGLLLTVLAATVFIVFYGVFETQAVTWAFKRYGETAKLFYSPDSLKDLIESQMTNTRRGAVFFLFAVTAAAAARRWRRVPAVLVSVCFIGLVGYDLLTANVAEPFIKKHLWDRRSENMEVIAKSEGLFRVLASPKAIRSRDAHVMKRLEVELMDQKDNLMSNLVMLHGFYDASGYDSIYLSDILEVQGSVSQLKSADTKFLDAMNIKFLVSPLKDLGPHYTAANVLPPNNLFENKHVLARAFLVEGAVTVTDRAKILERMKADDFEPERDVFLEEAVSAPTGAVSGLPEEKVTFLEYAPNRIDMKVSVAGRPWLFLSDTFFPGWKAFVDGVPTKIYRANYAFRAVLLPPGEHAVTWTYEPTFFRAGLTLTALTILFFVVYYGGFARHLKRRGPLV